MPPGPYDLADLGYPPVRIETATGRAEYARLQAGFAERAAPLRRRLLALCEVVLGEVVLGEVVLGEVVLGDVVLGP